MSHNVTPNTSRVELRKTLTLVPVVMMGLAYMQPMTLFDTFGIVSGLTDGHVPTAYAFALIAILFTALSYGKLVRRYPSAGSAYTYAQKSISPTVGFMVGWSSLLDYLFAPMINILLAKIYFEALVPSIPSWVFVVALVAFMTAFNLRSLKSVANFNTVIVVLQVVLIAVILGMVVYGVFEGEGAGTLASTRPFWSGDAHVIPMITGATILCFSFTGFDGISNLSEETKDAERVIPRAIFLTALIGGLIFIFATYFLQLYFPDISRLKIRMRLSRKSCCTWRVKPPGGRADLLYYHRTGFRYGGACRRSAPDVRYGARRRIPEKLLRLRSSEMAYASDEHHPGRGDRAAGD